MKVLGLSEGLLRLFVVVVRCFCLFVVCLFSR